MWTLHKIICVAGIKENFWYLFKVNLSIHLRIGFVTFIDETSTKFSFFFFFFSTYDDSHKFLFLYSYYNDILGNWLLTVKFCKFFAFFKLSLFTLTWEDKKTSLTCNYSSKCFNGETNCHVRIKSERISFGKMRIKAKVA